MFTALKIWLGSDALNKKNRESRCACCGNCCETFGGHLNATKDDLQRWRREEREDLLGRVNRLG
jgi:hypothetical protein